MSPPTSWIVSENLNKILATNVMKVVVSSRKWDYKATSCSTRKGGRQGEVLKNTYLLSLYFYIYNHKILLPSKIYWLTNFPNSKIKIS